MPTVRLLLLLLLLTLGASTARAEGGTIAGKVEAAPPKFLPETVVYVRGLKGPPVAPKRVAIDQKALTFIPHVLAINVHDVVEFLNSDPVEHNVFTPDNEGYNLGMIRPGDNGTYTFDKPGVYTQLCSVHAEMLAYVFVGENPFHAVVDGRGAYRLEHVPAGTYVISVWNSHLKAADQTVTVVEGKTVEANFSVRR